MSEFKSIAITEAEAHIGQNVTLRGHLQSMRDLGQIAFFSLRGASGAIQVVVEGAELLAKVSPLALETPLFASGVLQERAVKGKAASTVELVLSQVEVLADVSEAPPIEIGKNSKIDGLSPQTLLDYRPLSLRNEKVRAIFKIEAQIVRAFREYLDSQAFTEIHSSKLVSTGTEGGAQLFHVDYFGRKAYLAQSPQFYKQIMVGVFERVYEVGPVYRAEEHDTTRHLNEYISLDFEMGFIRSVQDVIAMQVGLLRHIFAHVAKSCAAELAMYNVSLPVIGESIAQIELAEARKLLTEKYGWQPEANTLDLDGEGEKILCSHFEKETGLSMVYVTNYPHAIRPFYAMAKAGEPLGSQSFDLLYGGLEITTGGQRIHKYDELVRSIQSRGLNAEEFGDYLLCFKHGMPPHGGLAIGLERLAKQMLNLPSVKQTALFPRDINRLTP